MEDKTIKKSHIIITVIMLLIAVSVGTYAWLTYQTNRTAMVLTIGEINSVQITLKPYQFKLSITPQGSYTSDDFITVTAVNNSTTNRTFRLYYKIDTIDNDLISSNFRYTIERSTNGTTYTEYQNGNFSTASNGSTLTILEESIPGNSTTYYYKVYIWLYSQSGPDNNAQGKTFNGELNAQIAGYQYQFVEYIGTIYGSTSNRPTINTGIASSNDIYAEVDAVYTSSNTASQLVISSGTSAGQWAGSNGAKYAIGTTNEFRTTVNNNVRKIMHVTFNSSGITLEVDGETVTRSGNKNTGNNYSIFNSPSGTATAGVNVYSVKIYNSANQLLRDYVPCYRKKDSVIGLYDVINDIFYPNVGTGSFIQGNAI